MTRDQFINLAGDMTDDQRSSAFNFLHGELSVYFDNEKSPPAHEEIFNDFKAACEFGRRVGK